MTATEAEMGNATVAYAESDAVRAAEEDRKSKHACRHWSKSNQALFLVGNRISDHCECCRLWVCWKCRHECLRCHGNTCNRCWDGRSGHCHRCTEAHHLQWMTSRELLDLSMAQVTVALRRVHVNEKPTTSSPFACSECGFTCGGDELKFIEAHRLVHPPDGDTTLKIEPASPVDEKLTALLELMEVCRLHGKRARLLDELTPEVMSD